MLVRFYLHFYLETFMIKMSLNRVEGFMEGEELWPMIEKQP